jgi:thymidylate synthase
MKFKKEDLHESGRPLTQEEFINKIKTDDEFAKKWGELGPVYGKQWRNWLNQTKKNHYVTPGQPTHHSIEIDQIANLISELKTNPDSRRLMVNAWNVGELDQMVLPPCHYGFQVYTRELSLEERMELNPNASDDISENDLRTYIEDGGKTYNMTKMLDDRNIPTRAISLMWNQRSVDTGLGLPFNIASYGLLLEIIAKEVNMIPDELIGNLGDCHIYNNHIDGLKEQINRESFPLPKLNINTEFWQTESGECGVGPLKTNLNGFEISDFTLENYQSHPSIKLPLSN